MITVYPSETRYSVDQGWLRSSFSFSFGPYYDPENTSFGPMRVLNDDYVAPKKGFGAHPHSDMEIVSIVLSGKLRHEDSLGNVGVTSWGEIQRMSAGTGIIHTEFSASENEELNLLQMWFMPEKRGIAPSYEITEFNVDSLQKDWIPVVSKKEEMHVAKIHQDISIYLRRLNKNQEVSFESSSLGSRRFFLFVIDGHVTLNKQLGLKFRDSARIEGESVLKITANEKSLIMLIDLP
jgi:quercetin 2,3-dioxygenase